MSHWRISFQIGRSCSFGRLHTRDQRTAFAREETESMRSDSNKTGAYLRNIERLLRDDLWTFIAEWSSYHCKNDESNTWEKHDDEWGAFHVVTLEYLYWRDDARSKLSENITRMTQLWISLCNDIHVIRVTKRGSPKIQRVIWSSPNFGGLGKGD